jgi:hypothetical protein
LDLETKQRFLELIQDNEFSKPSKTRAAFVMFEMAMWRAR